MRRVVSQQRMKFEPFELSSNTAADWTNAEMDVETISVEKSALRRNSINRRVFAGCVQKRIASGELLVHTMVTSVKPKRTASFANPNGLRSNLATRYFRRITYKIHALVSFQCNCYINLLASNFDEKHAKLKCALLKLIWETYRIHLQNCSVL